MSVESLKRQKAFAWAKYFEITRDTHNDNVRNYQIINAMNDCVDVKLPTHLHNEMNDLLTKTKQKIDCPICLEIINMDDLHIVGCGHKFHSNCIMQCDKCPICRKRLKKN